MGNTGQSGSRFARLSVHQRAAHYDVLGTDAAGATTFFTMAKAESLPVLPTTPEEAAALETRFIDLWRSCKVPLILHASIDPLVEVIGEAMGYLEPGYSLRFLAFRGEPSGERLVPVLGQAVGLAETIWTVWTDGRPTGSPEAQGAVESELMALIELIPHAGLKHKYHRWVRDKIWELGRKRKVVRANGHSLHSTNPGSIRLTRGDGAQGMTLRDADAILTAIKTPFDDQIDARLSDRARGVVDAIRVQVGSGIELAAIEAGLPAVAEARAVLKGAGL